ncbi:hypothetical protein LINPERHAP1_LOCUS18484 [Linum perenne]
MNSQHGAIFEDIFNSCSHITQPSPTNRDIFQNRT